MELAVSCSSMIPDFFVIDNDTGSNTSRSKKDLFGSSKRCNESQRCSSLVGHRIGRQSQMITNIFDPRTWTYLYDLYPLAKNPDKYVDHNKLNLAATKEELSDVLRIVITTVNILTAKRLVFDNTMMHTEAKQILPSLVYSTFGFLWI